MALQFTLTSVNSGGKEPLPGSSPYPRGVTSGSGGFSTEGNYSGSKLNSVAISTRQYIVISDIVSLQLLEGFELRLLPHC